MTYVVALTDRAHAEMEAAYLWSVEHRFQTPANPRDSESSMNRLSIQNVTFALPKEAFDKYRGQWIALSPDGTRILAHDDDLGRLEDKLIAAGESPDRVLFDRVEDTDISLGGAEL